MGRDGGRDPAPDLRKTLALAVALAIGVFIGLGLYADFDDLRRSLASFGWRWFPLALALTFVNYLLRFLRWQLYLRRLAIGVPTRRSFSIFLAGLVMTLSPAKLGEVLKSALLRRSFGVPLRRSAPIVLVERISDALGLVAVGVVAGAGAAGSWLLVSVVAAAAVALVLVVRAPFLDRWGPVADARATAGELLGIRLLAGTTVLSAAAWSLECMAAYACVQGLDLDVSLADTAVAFSVGSLAGAVSFLPGGIGVAETGMTGLFRALGGVSAAGAAAATVFVRLSTLWFAVALGLAALAVEQRLARTGYPVPAEPAPPGRRSSIR